MDENILNDSWEPKGTTSQEIKKRIKADKARFWAGDNVSKYLEEGDKQKLIEELTPKFESVLDSLLIDRENDPNSNDTGRRLAKMYINELMAGRYNPMPNATAFPQEMSEAYTGILTVRSELKSVCSHHHQPVSRYRIHWNTCGRETYWIEQVHKDCPMVCKTWNTARRIMQQHSKRDHESNWQ